MNSEQKAYENLLSKVDRVFGEKLDQLSETQEAVVNRLLTNAISRSGGPDKVTLAQAKDAWSTLAALTSAELLSRIPEMTPTALAKTAQVSARAAELMRGDEAAQEIKAEPSSEEWKAFVERVRAEQE